ncbi:hypothetical protein [Desulfobacter vibrioformis]|uniref:hypothetical protein n=1 Tax=Desulfobacter vibrioformis TaxID=34031 RepID=UPI0005572ABF|nr:hypothetical protein [Desulfobacter vibrioformis]
MLFHPNFLLESVEEIDLAIQCEKITDVGRKTWKSIFNNERSPRDSTIQKACDGYNTTILNEFGMDMGLKPEMLKNLEPGNPWELFFNNPVNKKFCQKHLPETKKLILFLEQRGLEFSTYAKNQDFIKHSECFSELSLAKLKFEQDILLASRKATSVNEYCRFTMLFFLRILLYCMASLDAELFDIPEKKSQFRDFLPCFESNEIKSPIKRWFEYLMKRSACRSWEEIAEKIISEKDACLKQEIVKKQEKRLGRLLSEQEKDNFEDEEYMIKSEKLDPQSLARQFRRWSLEKVKPKNSTVLEILACLFPEHYTFHHYMFYKWVKHFNFIFHGLDEMINKVRFYKGSNQDIEEFFQDYNIYYDYFVQKYTAPISDR